jgi:hypothetical protein
LFMLMSSHAWKISTRVDGGQYEQVNSSESWYMILLSSESGSSI